MSLPLPSISNPALAAAITRSASLQTYYTIRFLVDRSRVGDAYRAYAYFRWVDDWLDQEQRSYPERLAFLQRQQTLIAHIQEGFGCETLPEDLAPEERLALDLFCREPDRNSGLYTYAHNMMAVMAFDTERRGRLISQSELDRYTHFLAVAVTESMHYFIGHNCGAPCDESRYQAVSGAHIVHMLRDTLEDVAAGYYNIPQEVLFAGGIAPSNVESLAYRNWVQERVSAARICFAAGKAYLTQVESLRCRLAAYAYIHRFEVVLHSIEREGYLLRAQYPERKGRRRSIEMIGWALWMALKSRRPIF